MTVMRIALALIVTLGFAGAASAQEGALAEKGLKLFADQKCSMCHSVADKGNKKGPLDGVGAKFSADEMKQWLTDPKTMAAKTKAERKPAMKSFASLPAADLDALVAYLLTLK